MNKAVLLDLQGTLGGSGLDDIRTFSFYPFSIPAIKIFNEMNKLRVSSCNVTFPLLPLILLTKMGQHILFF